MEKFSISSKSFSGYKSIMGWLTGWNSRDELTRHLLSDSMTGRDTLKIIRHCFRGNILWAVYEDTKNLIDEKPKHFIVCFMMRCYREKGGYGMDWGYKDVDENMGPVYYTCPLSFLKLAWNYDKSYGYAEQWRSNVVEFNKRKAKNVLKDLSVGTKIIFEEPIQLTHAGPVSEFHVQKSSYTGRKELQTRWGTKVKLTPSCFERPYQVVAP